MEYLTEHKKKFFKKLLDGRAGEPRKEVLEKNQNDALYEISCILGSTPEDIPGQTPQIVLKAHREEILKKRTENVCGDSGKIYKHSMKNS